jgi:AraC family transcriptional activator of pobA
MGKKEKIPVHQMDDWFAGVYIKPFGAVKASGPAYEIAEAHRHDFYYCVIVEKGELELEVDFEKVRLTDQTLFLSYPGQVHRIIAAQLDRGWFLAFDPALLDEQLKNILDQCLSEIVRVPLSRERSAEFCNFISQLFAVYDDPMQLFRQAITQSLVTALVYQLASAYLSEEKSGLTRHSARSIEITKTFKQLLRRNFKTMKKPSAFAAQMHITVSHLNDTVRAVTGFPVTYYIQQELIREAKRLLYHSDLSVKEIANSIGFDDALYFNRLFRKVSGISPGAFRKKGETAI